MKQEERLEELLLEKSYQDLSSKDLALLGAMDWSQADYQAERILRLELKHWATAPVPSPNLKPNLFPNSNPNYTNTWSKWAIAACWLFSLATAAFIGFQSAKDQPIEVVEKIIYQSDTVYISRPAAPIAAKVEAISPSPNNKPFTAIVTRIAPPKSIALRDSISEFDHTHASRSMAADRDIMKLTSRVW